jgi:hypothetical protein
LWSRFQHSLKWWLKCYSLRRKSSKSILAADIDVHAEDPNSVPEEV